MSQMEQRFLRTCELRAVSEPDDEDGDSFGLEGYASVFNEESTDDGLGFREVVKPGAFARSIESRSDVKALFNHDPNRVLGRVKNGTLRLKEDKRGLLFHVKLDRQNPEHQSLYRSISRGDIDECSFGFIAQSQEWNDRRDKDGNLYAQRTLHSVDLMDVSCVTYPAYGSTSVAARSVVHFFPQGIPNEIRSRVPRLATVEETVEISKAQLLDKLRGQSV